AKPPATSKPSRTRRDIPTLLVVIAVSLILIILIGIPLMKIFVSAFSVDGREAVGKMITSPVNRQILVNTIVLGVVVGAIGTAIGFALAYAQARMKFRGKKFLHLLALLPIVSPPFAVATAVITL